MRRYFRAFRPLLTAGILLVMAVAGSELALRLENDTDGESEFLAGSVPLTEPCSTAFRRLPRLRTTVTRQPDTGETIRFAVNSHGLRGEETAVPKPPGVFRVLCLGDETVLGPYIDDEHTLPARLQQLLQAHTPLRVEVLNAGVPGDCPLLSWLRLRHSLIGLQPDLIVLHVDMSDVDDDRGCRRATRLDPAGAPIACPHPVTMRSTVQRPWWRNLHLTELLIDSIDGVSESRTVGASSSASTAWLRDQPPDCDLYVQQSLAPLEEIQRAAAGTGALFVVSTCPQPWQVSAQASAGPGVREAAGIAPGLVIDSRVPFEAIADFARSHGMLCCDTSRSFRECPEPARLYLRNAPTLSRLGNELYARVLSGFLIANLPASPGQSSPIKRQTPLGGTAEPNSPDGVTISFDRSRRGSQPGPLEHSD